MRGVVFAALAALACGDGGLLIAPVVDAPPAGSDAHPFEDVDQFTLAVAVEGSDVDLAFKSTVPGGTLSLTDVPFGDDLVFHMSGLSSGVEVAYGRACAVDIPFEGDDGEPHLYFSSIVKWGTAPTPNEPTRSSGAGFASRSSGTAAFVGGSFMTRADVFDARTGAFVELADELVPRDGGVLADFGDGRAALVGGQNESEPFVTAIEVIDLRDRGAATVDAIGGIDAIDHAAATLVDGSVLVTGGRTRDTFPVPTGEAYSLGFGVGNALAPPVPLADMTVPRFGHSMTRLTDDLSSDVLVIGGRGATGMVNQIELYRPLREVFELVATEQQLVIARDGHTAVRLPDGSVVVIGGFDEAGDPVPSFEVYDQSQTKFGGAVIPMPAEAGLTEFAATPLPDGRVLLTGGRDATGAAVADVFIARVDPINGQVDISPTDRMEVPRAGHSAVLLCDGTVLVVGGTTDAQFAERYNPPSGGRR